MHRFLLQWVFFLTACAWAAAGARGADVRPAAHSATQSATQSAPQPTPILVSAEQLREDLSFVRKTLAQTHPDPGFSTDAQALQQALDALAQAADGPVTQDQAWQRLATLNPHFADGHLAIGYPDWRGAARAHLQSGGTLFPYEVELSDGALTVRAPLGGGANTSPNPLRGARIVAIDGKPAQQIIAALLARVHGDTPAFRANLLAQRWWFFYWKMLGSARSYRLTLDQHGKTSSIDAPGSSATPALLQTEADVDAQFRLAFQPDGSAVLTVGSFAPADRERYLAFTRDAFTQLRKANTPWLRIDISANGGGDDATWLDGLMPYLATSRYRTGSTYIKKGWSRTPSVVRWPARCCAARSPPGIRPSRIQRCFSKARPRF